MERRKCKSCGKKIKIGFFCTDCRPRIQVLEYYSGSDEPRIWMDKRCREHVHYEVSEKTKEMVKSA